MPEKIVVPRATRRYGSFGSLTKGRRRQLYKSKAQSFQKLMLISALEDLESWGEEKSVGRENHTAESSRPQLKAAVA